MNKTNENRREFLKRASLTAVAFPFLLNCKSDILAQKSDKNILDLIKKNAVQTDGEWNGAKDAPADVSWQTVLSKKTDKTNPMIVSGTIYEADGKTPAPNVLIYLYHTDINGIYGTGGEHRHGHYRGWMLTDDKGRYKFTSIKPASYPNSTIASHVHITLTTKDMKEDWIDSILFEGDKFISEREREKAGKKGGFNPIIQLEKGADGILRGERDIQLWET